jgi:hypothetical protein
VKSFSLSPKNGKFSLSPYSRQVLPPIGLRGRDGKNPLFPLLPFLFRASPPSYLSLPERPRRRLSAPPLPGPRLPIGPAARPAWPPGSWSARAALPSLLGRLARLGRAPCPGPACPGIVNFLLKTIPFLLKRPILPRHAMHYLAQTFKFLRRVLLL